MPSLLKPIAVKVSQSTHKAACLIAEEEGTSLSKIGCSAFAALAKSVEDNGGKMILPLEIK